MKDIGEEFAARAAVFRRLAAELRSEEDRLALLAVAEEYEAESERLKASPGPL
jgi:acyl-CoA reductase-like NAD-dependent aldehyde dehydrogenase